MAATLEAGSGEDASAFLSSIGKMSVLNLLLVICSIVCIVIFVVYVLLPKLRKKKTPENSKVTSAPLVSSQNSVQPGKLPPRTEWVNGLIAWIYLKYRKTPELANCWLKSLNDAAKQETGGDVQVQFDRLQRLSSAPTLSDLTLSQAKDELNLEGQAKVDNVTFVVFAKEETGNGIKSSNFNVRVRKLEGKAQFRLTLLQDDIHLTTCFKDAPTVEVASHVQGDQHPNDQVNVPAMEKLIKKLLTTAICTFNLSSLRPIPSAEPVSEQVKNIVTSNSLTTHGMPQTSSIDVPSSSPDQKKLLMKIIKANGLGSVTGCVDPYCVVELDDPPSKVTTSTIRNTVNPFWDEHFNMHITDKSEKLTFQLYDRNKNTGQDFLGTVYKNVKDLQESPSSRHIFELQPRHGSDEQVSGTITVECDFPEQLPTPEFNLQMATPSRDVAEIVVSNVDSPADAALRDLSAISSSEKAPTPTTSTIMISAVKKSQSDVSEVFEAASPTEAMAIQETPKGASLEKVPTKKKGFMGTLKRRFSLRKRRSTLDGAELDDSKEKKKKKGFLKQSSVDRDVNKEALTVPKASKSDGQLDMPPKGEGDTASEGSHESATTFFHENSTLVIKTTEKDKSNKYYLIPADVAKSGLKKLHIKGTKLHIYNDHIFSATHLSGGTTCQVCTQLIPRKFGKQGYMCKDCKLVCHKACHYKVEAPCPSSTLHNIDMIHLESSADALDEDEGQGDKKFGSLGRKEKKKSKEKKKKISAAAEGQDVVNSEELDDQSEDPDVTQSENPDVTQSDDPDITQDEPDSAPNS